MTENWLTGTLSINSTKAKTECNNFLNHNHMTLHLGVIQRHAIKLINCWWFTDLVTLRNDVNYKS